MVNIHGYANVLNMVVRDNIFTLPCLFLFDCQMCWYDFINVSVALFDNQTTSVVVLWYFGLDLRLPEDQYFKHLRPFLMTNSIQNNKRIFSSSLWEPLTYLVITLCNLIKQPSRPPICDAFHLCQLQPRAYWWNQILDPSLKSPILRTIRGWNTRSKIF